MAVSVAAVMRHINNFFEVGCISERIAIGGNAIVPDPGSAWCYISGSWMHDGLWPVQDGKLQGLPDGLPDEEFDGRVWQISPPPDFLDLCKEISAYDDKVPAGAMVSEGFGSYNYNRGSVRSWMSEFSERLLPYRRMFTEVG